MVVIVPAALLVMPVVARSVTSPPLVEIAWLMSRVLAAERCTSASAAVVAWLAMRQIGGHTGDVLGAVQQSVEVAVLLAVVAVL